MAILHSNFCFFSMISGWSGLLSRKALVKASKHLKEICGQCSLMQPGSVPSILSACLVSLEPDSALRLMPDQFTPDERFSQTSVNCQLSTPQDVTCTHILVFPTSATTQVSYLCSNKAKIINKRLFPADILSSFHFSVFTNSIPRATHKRSWRTCRCPVFG